jgi:mitofusin
LREQHQKRLTDFLVNELKVCSAAQAKDRFFFVSAREMLEARLKARGEIKNGGSGGF